MPPNLCSPPNDAFANVVESFYLETSDGLFFAVKGLVHPPDRFVAVVRYAPDPKTGERKRDGIFYRRLYHFDEQERLLQSSFPQYIAYDPMFQITLQSVPRLSIRQIYDPHTRLKELTKAAIAGTLEADAVAFTGLLQQAAGVPLSAIGVTGSLLIGLHNDSSDLDLAIFGMENCRRVYQALGALLDSGSCAELQRLDENGIKELYRQRVSDTHMEFREFADLEKNKICQGSYRSRPYFIRFIKYAHESGARYPDLRYRAIGRATITATIADDQDAIFTPCSYKLSQVCNPEWPNLGVDEIISFRGRFCEQARAGELVRASGMVERVENIGGEIRYHLLLGNSPDDIMVAGRQ
jgi:uncharacterized protein